VTGPGPAVRSALRSAVAAHRPWHDPGLEAPAAWRAWLDELAAAADELERRMVAGEPALFPELPAPPVVDGGPGLPDQLVPATRQLLDRLEALQYRAEAQQHALQAALEGLPRPRPRARFVADDELGAALDVAG
jgi:hypothetical protein